MSGIPFFMPFIEIINIYILLFLQNNRETLCLIFFADKQKTNYCKIVKSLSLLCLGTFLSPLSHYFDSAGIVTPPRGENRSQRKSESLDEYLGRFRHTGDMLPLCNFRGGRL